MKDGNSMSGGENDQGRRGVGNVWGGGGNGQGRRGVGNVLR